MVARVNPFFASTNTFFAPSVGEKIDNATARVEELAAKAKAESAAVKDQAYSKVQDITEVAKVSVKPNPVGVDLYAR
jgi:solute carrier family 25 (mitochondrial phosphate transporter), member 3